MSVDPTSLELSLPSASDLASGANFSVAQYYRRFRREYRESPIRQRRRLALERAAYELTRTARTVAEIAIRAGFGSFEGFSRAFRRAFGVSPSQYRALGATEYRLNPQSSVHFAVGPGNDASRQGELTMNMLDRMLGAHFVHLNALLDQAETLDDAALDATIEGYNEPLPWAPQTQSLRGLLQMCSGAEPKSRSIAAIRGSMKRKYDSQVAETRAYEESNQWDMTFVDAACEPPQVFSYGGWIGHVVSMDVYWRMACQMALHRLGLPVTFQGPNEFDELERRGASAS